MLKSNEILYSSGNNDECYTPEYGVEPIIKYIPKEIFEMSIIGPFHSKPVIWCPFDTEESNFVKMIRNAGFKVICSHINNGQDFYNYEPKEHWDIIISNPPFTNKKQIFERALSFGKPFALLMTITWLNDSGPKKVFKNKNLQLLMFDKRINYIRPNVVSKNSPTFSSAYYCIDFLPKQIIMEDLNIKK